MEMPRNGEHAHHTITVHEEQEWASMVREKLELSFKKHHKLSKTPYPLPKVPPNIRKGDPQAYEPRSASIGPYHATKDSTLAMVDPKWQCVSSLLAMHPHCNINECLHEMLSLTKRLRACYNDDDVDWFTDTSLAQMMLIDGYFIISLLLTHAGYMRRHGKHNIWTSDEIKYDLLVLENQTPFFVLVALFDELRITDPPYRDLCRLAIHFFDLHPRPAQRALIKPDQVQHLLHLFHMSLTNTGGDCMITSRRDREHDHGEGAFQSGYRFDNVLGFIFSLLCCCFNFGPSSDDESAPKSVPCATELEESGVKFKKKLTEGNGSFLGVTFRDGSMEVPPLHVYDYSNSVFRNLIAFEQCTINTTNNGGTPVTDYAMLMDSLVDTAQDVAILHRSGIIVHGLGSDKEVARLFNRLCNEVCHRESSSVPSMYGGLYVGVEKYCSSDWHRWWAGLKLKYFNSPWAVVSLVAAIVLLVLTLVQTYYSVLGYYNDNGSKN
ncbi:UPF0481 protein [Acorus gramineus]|uniref:UPF0481 protein n=1 Tax=Acorus gramineus TaxID=55184 RepID=A0AAV9BMS6_ACOGR|nr:UPF0481 protein [Acorus gramineus]